MREHAATFMSSSRGGVSIGSRMSSVSACACASLAASISDDVPRACARGGRGHHLRQHRQADLVDEFVLQTTEADERPVPRADCNRPSGAQRRRWGRISVRTPALPSRYEPRRTCVRSASTRSSPLSAAQGATFRRTCTSQILRRSHERQSRRAYPGAGQPRALRSGHESGDRRIGWTSPIIGRLEQRRFRVFQVLSVSELA